MSRKSTPAAPLAPWQALFGFAPDAKTPPDQLRAGAKNLLAHVRREFARFLDAHAHLDDPHYRPYSVFGENDTPGEGLACPFALWEPAAELALRLGLPESTLSYLCKLASGFSARQCWDLLKAQRPEHGVRARLREELRLAGAEFFQHADPHRATFGQLLNDVRRRRRERGESLQSRAWHGGFVNNARLQFAVFALEGRTVAQLELEMLAELFSAWQAQCAADPRKRTEEGRRAAREGAAARSASCQLAPAVAPGAAAASAAPDAAAAPQDLAVPAPDLSDAQLLRAAQLAAFHEAAERSAPAAAAVA